MFRAILLTGVVVAATGCDSFLMGTSDVGKPRVPGEAQTPVDPTKPIPVDPMTGLPTNPALQCTAPTPGLAPMRRLSHVEYRFVVEDLFGNAALGETAVSNLVSDPVSLGYSNSAALLDVKPVLGQQYQDSAEKVAETVTANLTTLLPCSPTGNELGCATQFIQGFVRKAYRRPLTAEEETRYVEGYKKLRAAYDFKTGIEWVVSTTLQAPSFLYRPELDEGSTAVRKVKPLELASRLSFLIWHSLPDDALLAAATEGRLATAADVEREVRRMIADPKGARILNFFEEWLDLDKMNPYARDAAVFPGLATTLPALFRTETRTFVDSVLFKGDAKFATLMSADYTFVNETLSKHYKLGSVTGTAFQKVALPAGRRGVWMQGGPLTAHDKQYRTSIVNRGMRVRTQLLCHNIPAPPNDVSLTLGPIDQTMSQADRLAAHRTNPSCAGCHSLMDPIGQVFENVDAVGRMRVVDEAGRAVVTGGELSATQDANGALADGAALVERLSGSEQAQSCFATQLFRYTHGRVEENVDACSRQQAFDRFKNSGFDVRELIVGVAVSDDFLFRTPPQN